MAWGAVAGVGVPCSPTRRPHTGPELASDSADPDVLSRGVLLPLLGVGLMLAGPLVLLPYRRFNDVLDGATFGAATAVSFVAA